MAEQDFYEVLGVSRTATDPEIKKAYRRLAMKYHPDRNQGGDKATEEKFKKATMAYEVLSDQAKRRAYDQYGHAGVDPSHGFGGGSQGQSGFGDMFENIFSDIFGAGGPGAGRGGARQARGADLRYGLQMSLEDAVFGKEVTVTIPTYIGCKPCSGKGANPGSKPKTCSSCQGQGQVRVQQGFFAVSQSCPTCRGSGQMISDPCRSCQGQGRIRDQKKLNVKIPAGVDEGDRVRLTGEGEAAPLGGTPGDLFVEVHLKPHAIFERQENNLYCEVPISIATAVLGGEIEVPTLQGQVKLKIPVETQTNRLFKLSGKGIKPVRGGATGDLLCRVTIETPVNLTREQKALLQQFQDSFVDNANKKSTPKAFGWGEKVKNFIEALKS